MADTGAVQEVEATTQDATTATAGAVEQVAEAPATTATSKKTVKSGDLFMDIAVEVEQLTKTKALNEAERLAENVEVSYFRMGGVLKLIMDNSWFEGFPTFDDFVFEKFGFAGRKGRYLIDIYKNLVEKQIPFNKVQHLGWTKLKDLAPILTLENLDSWIAKATPITVLELQALLKAAHPGSDKPTTGKADSQVLKFPGMKSDQVEVVTKALAKAKGELHTEYDTVALEQICAGYLGGNSAVVKHYELDEVIQNTGFDKIMNRISEMFPEYDISVAPAEAPVAK